MSVRCSKDCISPSPLEGEGRGDITAGVSGTCSRYEQKTNSLKGEKKKMNYRILTLTLALLTLISGHVYAALQLEGQSGIFLNSLAYTIPDGSWEISNHNVNLDNLGSVATYNVSTGLGNNIEVGYTRITSSVTGVNDQNLLLAKWQFAPETKSTPGTALWAIHRDVSGAKSSTDIGLSATKVLTVANHPLVIDLGVRSTKAIGLGLFGFQKDRELKFEGSAALFVTKKFAVGTEFKQQVGGIDTWKDIAFRFVPSDSLNIDFGIANLGPSLDNQVALAATWKR